MRKTVYTSIRGNPNNASTGTTDLPQNLNEDIAGIAEEKVTTKKEQQRMSHGATFYFHMQKALT